MNSPEKLQVINLIYAYIRGFLARKKFVRIKKTLEINRERDIENLNIQYKTSNLMKAESRRCQPYSKTGWKKFYPYDQDKFNVDYGKTFVIKLLIINNQEIYTGEININNQKHGFGISINKSGYKFTGYWFKNSFEGWGEYIDSDGNIFQGLFVNHKLNGKGEKFSVNGNHYEGDFIYGLRSGYGREYTKDHVYIGQFENDKKNNKGKLVYKNIEDFYEGQFIDNNITGKGEYKWGNGDVYIGDFINGKMHGKGLYRWPDGGEYEGEYIDNIKEGRGRFKWANGKIFEGPFVAGKPHGKGILKVNNNIHDVEFIEGKMKKSPRKLT